MQRLIGFRRQRTIDGNQIARPRRLARNEDLILAQSGVEREIGGLERRQHHALVDDLFGCFPERAMSVLLHLRHDQLLVEGAAVAAAPDWMLPIHRNLTYHRYLPVAPLSCADFSRIDPVLVA